MYVGTAKLLDHLLAKHTDEQLNAANIIIGKAIVNRNREIDFPLVMERFWRGVIFKRKRVASKTPVSERWSLASEAAKDIVNGVYDGDHT